MKELFKIKNIIFIVLTICCIGGCKYVSHRQNLRENEISRKIDSLPQLTTPQQVSDALAAPEKRLYLVIDYVFPRCETVEAPYGHLEGSFVYAKVHAYNEETERKDGKERKVWKSAGEKRQEGRLFFDGGIELPLDKASYSGVHSKTVKEWKKKYEYTYLLPDEPFTFIAELGQNSALLSGIESNCWLATGGKEQLTSTAKSSFWMTAIKVVLIIAAVIFVLLVVSSVMGKAQAAKDAEQRRINRQRSKAGNQQNEWFFKKNK